MRMYDIILNKREGKELTKQEVNYFVQGYTDGTIPDYQASALLMAIYFNGLNERETVLLTECMAKSGDTIDLSLFGDLSVDKHSTGGVGDKTSLIVAPIVAALGGKVSKMSGRGLGHTGGTIDKLESIPGFKTALSEKEFLEQVKNVGMAIVGQSANLAPADKKLYALRDVTATVDNIGLITSSIMSKKLAAGSKNIVLDVKVGSGAFMKAAEQAKTLAEMMVSIGQNCGRNMAALITNMDIPLGNAVGNALEVKEAIEILRGKKQGDLYEVCVALATTMISITFKISVQQAKQKVIECIESGAAFDKMVEWVKAQGGDHRYLTDPALFEESKYSDCVIASQDGYISAMNAEQIGVVAVMLGAGREKKEDVLDFSAGLILHKTVGEPICKGDVLATLYTNRLEILPAAQDRFYKALQFSSQPVAEQPLIYQIINGN